MAVTNSDRVVIDALFKEYRDTEYPGEEPDDVFEKYAVTQVLKPKELTADELASGIVDGDRDGGVDGFYVFLNGALLDLDDAVLTPGDPTLRHLGSHPDLEVFLTQSKNVEKWEESVWEHLLASLPTLLDVGAEDAALERHYRSAVVERTGILRRAIVALGPKFPKVVFHVVYVTRALESNLTATIAARGEQVAALVRSRLTTGAEVTIKHVGVGSLYQLAGTDYSKPGVLRFRNLIRESESFVGTVSLEDYLSFVRNDAGELRDDLFESNVRDFEGDNAVNEAITETLHRADDIEFWWLNNGVTILGDHVDSPQQTLTISRPLIVNGLQTSHVIHHAEKNGLLAPERLKNGVVVRVIESVDEDARDRIIAGTNRQTQVAGLALYATQPLQRDIERFLLVHDWYYERRKNRYKNQGKPAKRRVTIGVLAQALISVMLGQPDVARARPSTLLLQKNGYDSVFQQSLDPNAYLSAIEILKAVDVFLATDDARAILDESANTRFYVASGYVILQLRLHDTSNFRFETNFHRLTRPLEKPSLLEALRVLADSAVVYQISHPKVSRDSVFKSSEFREEYFSLLTTPKTRGKC